MGEEKENLGGRQNSWYDVEPQNFFHPSQKTLEEMCHHDLGSWMENSVCNGETWLSEPALPLISQGTCLLAQPLNLKWGRPPH